MGYFDLSGSKLWVINFYREQLDKLRKIGLGNETEHGVVVTDRLIETTCRRLSELTVVYDDSLRYNVNRKQKSKFLRKGRLNGHINNNGAITLKSSKDIGDNGHEGEES